MRLVPFVLLLAAAGACTSEDVTQSFRPLAQQQAGLRYRIDILPTSANGTEQGAAVNNDGVVAGYARQSNGALLAMLWQGGTATPLGTLGGTHSMLQWAGLNSTGMVVGISRTTLPDTLGEAWSCSAFLPGAGKQCLGFVYDNGVMSPLATLGGTNGFATGLNNRGQAVGWAETTVHDPTCTPGTTQVLQFKAVMWEPRLGTMRVLRPFTGDSTSAATAINNSGVAVGISGDCDQAVGRLSARRAVLWGRDGGVFELPNLGGIGWHTPMAINDRGDVVGFGNPPDGDFDGDSLRAFLWTRSGGLRDLGKMPGDLNSQALGINSTGTIVGLSCTATCRAIIWLDGQRRLLQDFAPGTPHTLWSARAINDQGQITGRLIEAGTNRRLAFIATPIGDDQ